MPIFECFSVFFCVYLRKCLIFSKKKVVFFLKKILKSVAQFKKMLYLYNVKEKQILTIKNETIMITKGTAEYKKAQEIANKLQDIAKTERWNSHEYFNIFCPIFEKAMKEVKKTNGFASQVAESVEKTIDYYGFKIASISSKQAWIIACAIVENDIELNYFNEK